MEENKITIREIGAQDLEKLSGIYVRTFNSLDAGEKWNEKTAFALLKHWFDRPQNIRFLAEVDGEIAGAFFTAIKPSWDGNNHLVDGEIFVDPDFQKLGIGTELSKVVYKTAMDRYDAKSFYAYTFKNLDHPLRWYKKLGFHEINDWTIISGNLREVLKKLDEK